MAELTGSPYYDDYDPQKGYYKILAQPGRTPQNRETNVLQSMFLDLLERLGDVLMKDGSIVSGCQISINEARTKATISSGQVYIKGIVYPVSESELAITGQGKENIGAKLEETIVTSLQDPSLADPAQTYSNFGQPGADRLKVSVKLVKDDPQAYTVYQLRDGVVDSNAEPPAVDVITDVLARRSFDESENFKVRGLQITVAPFDSEMVQAVISAGKCYVMGYEINKPAPTYLKINMSRTYRSVNDEPKLYDKNVTDYLLSTPYVRSVDELVGQAQVVEYITRGSILGGNDPLPKEPVFDIVAVNQGGDWDETSQSFSGGKTYRKGIDYQLLDNGVDWSLAQSPSDQPSLGSSYKVVWKYNRHFVRAQDFDLYLNPSNGRHYIRFLAGGIKPIHNTTYNVSYTWYLARKDLVYIDKDGTIATLQGQPDRFGLEKAPETTFYNLPLAYLTLPPNSSQVSVVHIENTRITQKGLQDIIKRVNTLEYNMAVTDLDKSAEDTENINNLSGILTDGFLSFGKADTTHPDYDATMNLFTNEVFIPANSSLKQLSLNTALSTVVEKDKYYLAPYGENTIVSQPFASGTMNINPYMVFNTESQFTLDPAVDNWIDETTIKLPSTIENSEQVTLPAKFVDDWWTSDVQRLLVNTTTEKKTYTGDATKIFEQASTFMRQITVNITGAKYSPGTDVKAKFDGKEIALTPTGSTEAGVLPGTIKTKSDGTFTASFVIPANTTTGTKTVVLHNDNNYAERPFTSVGFTRIFVQSETTLVTTVQEFQDIYGSTNKIIKDAVDEALNKANENSERIGQIEEATQVLVARMNKVEANLNQMQGLVYEIQMETDATRKAALQASYDAQRAAAIAQAAEAKADEALRQAQLAELNAQAAKQTADLALAYAKSADAVSKQALDTSKAVEGKVAQLQTAQTNLLNKTTALEQALQANQLAQSQALRSEIDSLRAQMQNLSNQVAIDQTVISRLASQLGYNVSFSSGSVSRIDPLAQSFAFRNATQLASIEVAFYTKGTLPINCQVRELSEGGMPTTRVVGEKVLKASEVKLSNDGSVMTKITFDTPVLCQADKDYCFVLITEDTDYQVFIGTLGQKDLLTGAIIGRQPYEIGVLFSSSNNISWNVHNDADLKFKLNAVSVTGDAVLVFDNTPVTSVNEIVLAVEQLVPQATRIEWEYKVNSTASWYPLPTFEKVPLPEVANTLQLKATIKSTVGSTVSPTILKSTSAIYTMSRQSSSSYITKNVAVSTPYKTVKQVLDLHLPTGTSYELQFSGDNGKTWITSTQTDVAQVDNRYSRFSHEAKMVLSPLATINAHLAPSSTGGQLPNGNYYYVITAVNGDGETTGREITTTVVGGSNTGKVTINLTGLVPEGATGLKIYRGTAPGSTALKYVFNTIPTNLVIVDDGSDTDSSPSTPPTTNTATYEATQFRGRINLYTTNILNTPRAKRFINIMRV
ncbi:hypothetical protein D1872_50480 [compost metagenome]